MYTLNWFIAMETLTLYCVTVQFPKFNKRKQYTGKYHKIQVLKQFREYGDALAYRQDVATRHPDWLVGIEERDYAPVKR